MTMTSKGLAKLLEEAGELQKELGELSQVAAKKLARMDMDEHFDGAGSLARRLEDEMGDVIAAIQFVASTFELDPARIVARTETKLARFHAWNADVSA